MVMSSDYSVQESQKLPLVLEKYDEFFQRLGNKLEKIEKITPNFNCKIWEVLAYATSSKHVFSVYYNEETNEWVVEGENEEGTKEVLKLIKDKQDFREILIHALNSRRDFVQKIQLQNGIRCVLKPFIRKKIQHLLVLYNVSTETIIDAIFSQVISVIEEETLGFETPISGKILEIQIYNSLKRLNGFVSDFQYNRQYKLFLECITQIRVVFEPIIFIDKNPYIWGWETLARDKETNKAPNHVFEAAEIWGEKFRLALDIYILNIGLKTYQESNSVKIDWGLLKPLSINVYPDSLMRNEYEVAMNEIQKNSIFPLNKLFLEISEKKPIPRSEIPGKEKEAIENFARSLTKFIQKGVRFAIDDFGVGYASSIRLSVLNIAMVKLDRHALVNKYGDLTLRYLLLVANEIPINIVVEGLDDESKIRLRELYEYGVLYIQGHKYGGKAYDKITENLTPEFIEKIKNDLV